MYSPGPAVVGIVYSLFSPILNPLTSELKRLPSSYYPGAAWKSAPDYANVPGRLGDDPKLIFGVFAFVIASALS